MNPFTLDGRTLLVTGASSGIGRAVALRISQMGGRVIAFGRDPSKLDLTLNLLEGEGHCSLAVDLADVENLEIRLSSFIKENGPFGGLVHCAGVTRTLLLRDTELSAYESLYNLNYLSFMLLAKLLCRRACHTPEASLVGIASSAGIVGQPGLSLYSGSKGALIASIRSLAAEYAPRGIRFNAIAPTYVKTPMLEEIRIFLGEERFKTQILDASPLGILEPEDIADSALFLLSPASKRITGSTLVLGAGASPIF